MSSSPPSRAITSLLPSLLSLPPPPQTHLPLLPLSTPTPTHALNLLSTLHLLHHLLSHPSHTPYFFHTHTSPLDTALRGLISLHLQSSAADNFLGSSGKLDERVVGEAFGVEVMREGGVESGGLKGLVRIGQRWEPGVRVVSAVMEGLRDVGGKLQGECLGEDLLRLLERVGSESGGDAEQYAELFCSELIELVPAFSSPSTTSPSLPSAPIRLLHDIAHLPSLPLSPPLPSPAQLADISPLPLPIPILLLLDLLPSAPPELAQGVQDAWRDVDVFAAGSDKAVWPERRGGVLLKISETDRLALERASVEVCKAIRDASLERGAGEGEVKRRALTYAEVEGLLVGLQRRAEERGGTIYLQGE